MIIILAVAAGIFLYFVGEYINRTKLEKERDREEFRNFTEIKIDATQLEQQLKEIEETRKKAEEAIKEVERAKKLFPEDN